MNDIQVKLKITQIKRIYFIWHFLFLLFIVCAQSSLGANVESIKINSTLFQFHYGKSECDFEIYRSENEYKTRLAVLDITRNKQKLDPDQEENYQWSLKNKKKTVNTDSVKIPIEKIKKFLEVVKAPPKKELDLNQLGINQEWLTSVAEKKLEPEFKGYTMEDIPEIEFYRKFHLNRLANVDFTLRKLKYFFNSSWSHDHPQINIEIQLNNGEFIKVSSKALHIFMVPWTIETNRKTYINYDLKISKALGNLLHPQCANFERIYVDLPEMINQIVWRKDVRNPWYFDISETIESLKALKEEVVPIKQDFDILESGMRSKNNSYSEDRWTAKLNYKTWPRNLAVNFVARVENGKLQLDHFSSTQVKKYGNRVLKVPWLGKYIKEHPYYLFSIQYENGVSITEEEYESFIKGFKKSTKTEWKNLNYPYSKNIIFIGISEEMRGFSYWLIFPDKTMALIGQLGDKLLKWTVLDKTNYLTYIEHHNGFGKRVTPRGRATGSFRRKFRPLQ